MQLTMLTDVIMIAHEVGPDIQDITDLLDNLVHASKIHTGTLSASVVGSTGSLTTIEFEPGVVEDLCDAIERIAPRGMDYAHERAWNDGNGHSHVQAALLGPGISIQIRDGRMALGTWQQVVSINHDNKPRQRRIEVTLLGNPAS